MKYFTMDPHDLYMECVGEYDDPADACDANPNFPVFSEDDLRALIKEAQLMLNT